MTEEEAISWVRERFGRETLQLCEAFVAYVIEENDRQNLISARTISEIWSRHVVDSLQLMMLVGKSGTWIDIGTGGGFPGMVVGLARLDKTLLVEPRRKRADFLRTVADALGLADRIEVRQSRVETIDVKAEIISARAVAAIETLFDIAHHCSVPMTRWLLPRGGIDPVEIEQIARRWQFMFHVEHSAVDGRPSVAIFEQVKRL